MNKFWILLAGILVVSVACESKKTSLDGGTPAVRALKTMDRGAGAQGNRLDFFQLKRGGVQSATLRFRAPAAGELQLKVEPNGLGVNCAVHGYYDENYEIHYTYLKRDPATNLFTSEIKPVSAREPVFQLAAGEELQILVELVSMCTCDSAQVKIEAAFAH